MDDGIAKEQVPVNIEDEIKKSYLDYAMSVIMGRAVPDVRDGLKPVHRRILYAMFREGLTPDRKFSKCAGVVGEVLKKYHPHGDAAVYDALVRMAQDFNMRYPLIDKQGNFGSIDGDPPAHYRYTESRLDPIAMELMQDIDKDTVNFIANFDETTVEPIVLPSRLPNFLLNGSSGIAVGMATNVPPHNLNEVCDAVIHLIQNPAADLETIMQIIPGPDFPTGGSIYSREAIAEAYRSGRGSIVMRANASIEKIEKGTKEAIIVHEIPYQVNKANLIKETADLVLAKKLEGISNIRDESDRQGMRIVIELKRGENAEFVLNNLYKHTRLQDTFGVIFLAIVDGRPQVLNIREILEHFVTHRREVIHRRTEFELKKAEARAHILEGLIIALDHLDQVIALIRRSANPKEARQGLITQFTLTEIQAQAILDMQLQRLTSMERDKILEEHKELITEIARLKEILAKPALIDQIIIDELRELKEEYGDARRTQILETEPKKLSMIDLVREEAVVITCTHSGYIKRTSLSSFNRQRRGGKGKIGMKTKEEDFLDLMEVASTHSDILIFTQTGKVYTLKTYELPDLPPSTKGKAMAQFDLSMDPDEKIARLRCVTGYDDDKFVTILSKKGIIKKVRLSALGNIRRNGLRIMNVREDDELLTAHVTDGTKNIFIGTAYGRAICFPEQEFREMGRTATGVRGIRLKPEDYVVGMEIVEGNDLILTITENGFGRRTPLEEYRIQGRSGSGLINMKIRPRNGLIVDVECVKPGEHIMMLTQSGMIIRYSADDVRIASRQSIGVRLMEVEEGDKIVAASKLPSTEDKEPTVPTSD
ncbi:DNA gyrase subunit A [bacterium]|nr:DNA gyrase subunit A [bacterium]